MASFKGRINEFDQIYAYLAWSKIVYEWIKKIKLYRRLAVVYLIKVNQYRLRVVLFRNIKDIDTNKMLMERVIDM